MKCQRLCSVKIKEIMSFCRMLKLTSDIQLKDIGKMRPKLVPLTNYFIAPT